MIRYIFNMYLAFQNNAKNIYWLGHQKNIYIFCRKRKLYTHSFQLSEDIKWYQKLNKNLTFFVWNINFVEIFLLSVWFTVHVVFWIVVISHRIYGQSESTIFVTKNKINTNLVRRYWGQLFVLEWASRTIIFKSVFPTISPKDYS